MHDAVDVSDIRRAHPGGYKEYGSNEDGKKPQQ
jgi:hypothetical protein